MLEELTPEEEFLIEFSVAKSIVPVSSLDEVYNEFYEVSEFVKRESHRIYKNLQKRDIFQELVKTLSKTLPRFRVRVVDAMYEGKMTPHVVVFPDDFPIDVEESLLEVRHLGVGMLWWASLCIGTLLGYYRYKAFFANSILNPVQHILCELLRERYIQQGKTRGLVCTPVEKLAKEEFWEGVTGHIDYILFPKHIEGYAIASGHLSYKGREIRGVFVFPHKVGVDKSELIENTCNKSLHGLEIVADFLRARREFCHQENLAEMAESDICNVFSDDLKEYIQKSFLATFESGNLFMIEVYDWVGMWEGMERIKKYVIPLFFLLRFVVPAFLEWDIYNEAVYTWFLPRSASKYLKVLLYHHAYEILECVKAMEEDTECCIDVGDWSTIISEEIMKRELCLGRLKAYLFSNLLFSEFF